MNHPPYVPEPVFQDLTLCRPPGQALVQVELLGDGVEVLEGGNLELNLKVQ